MTDPTEHVSAWDEPIRHPAVAEAHGARKYVARNAQDPADEALLLDALGLAETDSP